MVVGMIVCTVVLTARGQQSAEQVESPSAADRLAAIHNDRDACLAAAEGLVLDEEVVAVLTAWLEESDSLRSHRRQMAARIVYHAGRPADPTLTQPLVEAVVKRLESRVAEIEDGSVRRRPELQKGGDTNRSAPRSTWHPLVTTDLRDLCTILDVVGEGRGVRELAELIDSSSEHYHWGGCMRCLVHHGFSDPEVLPTIRYEWNGQPNGVWVGELIHDMGEAALPFVLEALDDPDYRDRAVAQLTEMGPAARDALPKLTEIANDPSEIRFGRECAQRAIDSISAKQDLPADAKSEQGEVAGEEESAIQDPCPPPT